jgi:hypothetical protein
MVEMDIFRMKQHALILNDGGEIPIDYKGEQYWIKIISSVPRVVYNGSTVSESLENGIYGRHLDCSREQFIKTFVDVKNHSNKITRNNEKAKRDALKRKRNAISERRKILYNEVSSLHYEKQIFKEKIWSSWHRYHL